MGMGGTRGVVKGKLKGVKSERRARGKEKRKSSGMGKRGREKYDGRGQKTETGL